MAYSPSNPVYRRPAFSLAEMMIAIVILGLGLLMVATMFPIGWTKAKELAEFANQTAITEAANTTTRLLTVVAQGDAPPFTQTSFLGDFDPTGLNDTFVHALHLQNVLADAQPGEDITFRGDYQNGSGDSIREPGMGIDHPPVQINFHERIFPPLSRRPMSMDIPPPPQAEMDRWDQMFANRRFGWSVLHRLHSLPSPGQTRVFTMYFVTLRRQAGQRFARQDPTQPMMTPEALLSSEDVRFPVPWLVRLTLRGNWDSVTGNPLPQTGVPSEAEANPAGLPDARLIPQLLMSGSALIDRLTGNLYTVTQHRFTGSGDQYDFQARMTLDREINEVDLGLSEGEPVQVGIYDDGSLPNRGGDFRDFWVFPPSVLKDRPDGFPIFDGTQPVVGIVTRTVAISP